MSDRWTYLHSELPEDGYSSSAAIVGWFGSVKFFDYEGHEVTRGNRFGRTR